MGDYNVTVNGKTSKHSTKKKVDDIVHSYNDLTDLPSGSGGSVISVSGVLYEGDPTLIVTIDGVEIETHDVNGVSDSELHSYTVTIYIPEEYYILLDELVSPVNVSVHIEGDNYLYGHSNLMYQRPYGKGFYFSYLDAEYPHGYVQIEVII